MIDMSVDLNMLTPIQGHRQTFSSVKGKRLHLHKSVHSSLSHRKAMDELHKWGQLVSMSTAPVAETMVAD